MYNEILEIANFCKNNNISCDLSELWGGYKLLFDDGADIVQHFGSYDSAAGCVEPAGFGDDIDYSPIEKDRMIKIIMERYK